ncbi:MAG: hypothetical protein E7401_04380 [Ruminococcaceae bacterium]|nr:hypothetical protein [Oscillospiraceae bacterium]
MKKYIFLATISLIVVALLLVSYPQTTTHKGIYTAPGLEDANDATIELTRTISFKSIINPNKIYGTISVSPYQSDDVSVAEFDFTGETSGVADNLYYVLLTRYNHREKDVTFANMWFDRKLNNIVIAETTEDSFLYISATEDFLNKLQQNIKNTAD